MYESRLQSSQELTPLIVNVEQTFSPCGVFSSDSPRPTLGFHPPPHKAASPGAQPQTPGGSSSTAAASIVRPRVRHRAEWNAALEDVEGFKLPVDSFLASNYRANTVLKVPVRYIADQFDRRWLAHRFMEGHQEGHTSKDGVVRGKTGQLGSAPRIDSDLTISLFEDIITAFELAAFCNPEISLERLVSLNRLYLEGVDASSTVITEVHEYWLRKREALGGNIACIPALQVGVCDENESAICRANVLGDYPLPFKARDWVVSCITRKNRSLKRRRRKAPGALPKKEDRQRSIVDFVTVAHSLSMQILQRERLRHKHAMNSIYEMAAMRNLSGVNFDMLHESPSWANRIVDALQLHQEVDCSETLRDFFEGLSTTWGDHEEVEKKNPNQSSK
ncbi:unnamed protein product [Phytomonas sp. Hart1]|nr:unnamed protein product [Phytomonas sp. Hart1]|eukprot:CCW70507.1 unnamed protein product [Phytomonas sp. isolate Hart1]